MTSCSLFTYPACTGSLNFGARCLCYAIVQLARILPGDPEIVLRLPSIFAFLLLILAALLFLRRSLGLRAGVAAALPISLSPFREFGYEARPYGLLAGMVAMAAVA